MKSSVSCLSEAGRGVGGTTWRHAVHNYCRKLRRRRRCWVTLCWIYIGVIERCLITSCARSHERSFTQSPLTSGIFYDDDEPIWRCGHLLLQSCRVLSVTVRFCVEKKTRFCKVRFYQLNGCLSPGFTNFRRNDRRCCAYSQLYRRFTLSRYVHANL